jgi:hypothetical protein
VRGRYKIGKHFTIEITDRAFGYERDAAAIAAEAALYAVTRRASTGPGRPKR